MWWEMHISLSRDKGNWSLLFYKVRIKPWTKMKNTDATYSFSHILKESSAALPAQFDKVGMQKWVFDWLETTWEWAGYDKFPPQIL